MCGVGSEATFGYTESGRAWGGGGKLLLQFDMKEGRKGEEGGEEGGRGGGEGGWGIIPHANRNQINCPVPKHR
jgi:hypothetical protein